MKNILVAGASGFLGSHLMLRHLSMGDVVIGIDNHSTSDRNSAHELKIIQTLEDTSRGIILERDITEEGFVEEAKSALDITSSVLKTNSKFDVIYNFACPASPPLYQKMPISTMMTSVVGTTQLLQLAKDDGAIMVHASTSEIYGDPEISPQSESYRGNTNPYGPRSCYDEGKRAAESLMYHYLHDYGVDARLVRIFNTYGPHMRHDDGRVVSNFISQIISGKKLTIAGDGSQTRSFCYVTDLIDAICSTAALSTNPHTPINIGNPEEFTINELALKVIQHAYEIDDVMSQRMFNNVVEYTEFPVDDPLQRRPNIDLAQRVLGWTPKINLDQGLAMTMSYFKGELSQAI